MVKLTDSADIEMWLGACELGEASSWRHAEEGGLLGSKHQAWHHERGARGTTASQKALSYS